MHVYRVCQYGAILTKGTNREKNPKRFCQNMNRFFDDY